MTITRRLARPMLASIFIAGGLDAFRHPESKAKMAEAVTTPVAKAIPGIPQDTELLVKVNGAVQVGAGAMLALGKFRRLASLALIGSIIPTTYAGHRFWEETDDASKAQQRVQFLKNLGLLGGLILALVDTEGAPSLSWRAKRRARRLSDTVGSVVVATGALAHHSDASGKAHRAADSVTATAHSVGGKASEVKGRAAKRANKAAAKSHAALLKSQASVLKGQASVLKGHDALAKGKVAKGQVAKGHEAALKGVHDASASATRLSDAATRAAAGAHEVALKRAHDATAAAAKLSESGGRAARKANKVAHQRAHEAAVIGARFGESGGRVAKRANDVAGVAAKAAKATAGDVTQSVSAAADKAGDAVSKLQDHLPVG